MCRVSGVSGVGGVGVCIVYEVGDMCEVSGVSGVSGVYTYIYLGCLLEFYILTTYQDKHRLVTVHTHGNIIVLPNW